MVVSELSLPLVYDVLCMRRQGPSAQVMCGYRGSTRQRHGGTGSTPCGHSSLQRSLLKLFVCHFLALSQHCSIPSTILLSLHSYFFSLFHHLHGPCPYPSCPCSTPPFPPAPSNHCAPFPSEGERTPPTTTTTTGATPLRSLRSLAPPY
jgi:hypothetical protein